MKKYLILFLCICFIFSSCEESTKPKTVTFSGTVTLGGETAHSGVKVMLFKPVTIDSALTNLNIKYPGIGLEINQITEFNWMENSPAYQSITKNTGTWEIENIVPGKYHFVAQKDSFGYCVIMDIVDVIPSIELNRSIKLAGNYYEDLEINNDTFVEIESDVFLLNNTTLKINPGAVLKFKNNNSLNIEGNLICEGNIDDNIKIYNENASYSNKIIVKNSNLCRISYTLISNIKNGIYVSSVDSISMDNVKIDNCDFGVELFNCGEFSISNSNIFNSKSAIEIDIEKGQIEKNIISNCTQYGIKIVNTDSIKLKNNLIQNCGLTGIASNPIQYPTNKTNMNIERNDLLSNDVHIFLGPLSGARTNYNNILNETTYLVRVTSNSVNDSLNFQNNFWGYTQGIDIGNKIEDYADMGQGVTIDYSNFLFEKYNWQSKLD